MPTIPERPQPIVLAVPPAMQSGTDSFVFVSKTMAWMGQAEAYMDALEAQNSQLAARVAELESTPLPPVPPIIEPPPQITVTEKPGYPWMDAILAPIITNIDLDLTGMRRGALTYSYRVVSRSDFVAIVEYWRRTVRPLWAEAFKAEPWDDVCDWWSWAFRGWVMQTFQLDSIGFVVDNGSHHSYNLVVYDNQTWELFDPQYDSYAIVGTTGHGFREGLILL